MRFLLGPRFLCVGLSLAIAAGALQLFGPVPTPPAQAADAAPSTIDFNRQIRPLLSENCFACHGPDEKQRKAKLRLDVKEGAFAKLKGGGSAIVGGKSAESELVARIIAGEPTALMPPPKSGKKLTPEQIALLRQWIDQGASWNEHWAFVSPKKAVLPKIANNSWPRNPIDHFILARLEAERLQPSAEAEKSTLIRRVTLDLTGLPPTPAEVDAFLADPAPDAFEKVVERLLQSPRYGEHMARFWLDAARYGDTHGLHLDNYREMWPYRDWVIKAFNANMPFDRFVVEQLAGDLLPPPSEGGDGGLSQQVATGFIRCHVTTSEGGSIEEECFVRNVVDRVETNGLVFFGLTVGCARCHDHKYDPIRMKDFYQMFAFFNNLDGKPLDGNAAQHPPVIRVPTAEQRQQLEGVRARIAAAEQRRQVRAAQAGPAFTAWLAELEKKRQAAASEASPPLPTQDLLVHYAFEDKAGEKVANAVAADKFPGRIKGKSAFAPGKIGAALSLDGKTHVDLGAAGDFERTDAFSYGGWVRATTGAGTLLSRMDDKDSFRGYDLYLAGDQVSVHLIHKWPDNALKVNVKKKLKHGDWAHVFVTYDGSSKSSGLKVYVNGVPEPFAVEQDRLSDTIKTRASLKIGARTPSHVLTGQVDEVRLYSRRLSDVEVTALAGSDPLSAILPILAVAVDERTEQQKNTLKQYYLDHHDAEHLKIVKEIAGLRVEAKKIEDGFPSSLVYKERSEPRPAYLLKRGEYDQRGDPVGRDTPAFLPPLPETAPRNRLGFAQWLVAPNHPLTARVAVNRFWQQCFGTGIVKTSEDFGSQGEPPSHPALLDWLAVQFIEDGWDVKKMMKRFVTSAAYRQTARLTKDRLAKDPANRLLARGPRFRLDAEMLRDQALAVSGLLVERIGGPGVKPPQPPGLWEAVGYITSNTRNFVADTGRDKVHRRSLYIFWKRTSPPPQMNTFDAPSREACTVRRERTNTPLQALLLLNETQYVEAARALAERTLREGGADPEARLGFLFKLAAARKPDAKEMAELLATYSDHLARFSRDLEAAKKLIAVGESKPDDKLHPGELAAWTMIANLVLNLDEVLNKG